MGWRELTARYDFLAERQREQSSEQMFAQHRAAGAAERNRMRGLQIGH